MSFCQLNLLPRFLANDVSRWRRSWDQQDFHTRTSHVLILDFLKVVKLKGRLFQIISLSSYFFAVFLGPCPASKKIMRKFRSRVIVLQYWTFRNTNLTPKHRRSVVLRSSFSIRKGLGLYGAPFPPKIDLCIRYSSGCILCYLTQCDIQLYVLTSWLNFSIVHGTFCFSHWHATISEGIKMFNLFMNNAMQVSTVNDKNSYLSHSVTMSL